MTSKHSLYRLAKTRGLKVRGANKQYSVFDSTCRLWGPGGVEECAKWMIAEFPRDRGRPEGGNSKQRVLNAFYQRAFRAGYGVDRSAGGVGLTIRGAIVQSFADIAAADAWLAEEKKKWVQPAPIVAPEPEDVVEWEATRVLDRASYFDPLIDDDAESNFKPLGLLQVEIKLPAGVTGDQALRAWWVAEDQVKRRGAPIVKEALGAAKLRLGQPGLSWVSVWLSDNDRASVEAYCEPAPVVLLAAILAEPRLVRRRLISGNLARGDSHAAPIRA